MRVGVWASSCLVVLAALSGWGNAAARAAGTPPVPASGLAQAQSGGAAALSALGGKLPAVAAIHGKTPGQLRRLFLTDPSLRVDRRGRLYFADPPPPGRPRSLVPRSGLPWIGADPAPPDRTFTLHSNPGANKTIYLNFRGRTLADTVWNGDAKTVNVPPFDTDGDPENFSSDELTTIQRTWQQVAEDYAPFDVDVTTEEVPDERIRRASPSDQVFGIEVLFVPLGGVLNCWCTGLSYMNSFFDTSDFFKPAMVFYDGTWAFSQYLADTASHEAGHSLGLSHDGTSASQLYDGHGDDPVNGWEPIMGSEGWRPLSQFSKGDYADASNQEDDFAVIQKLGLPLRPDDAGDSSDTALVLPVEESGGRSSGSFDGVITSAADRDVFAIWAGAGTLTVNASPAVTAPNADLLLTLRDSAGQVLAVSNPLHDLAAGFSHVLAAPGRYTLALQGTGEGDSQGPGYPAYGSVGAYRLTASYPSWAGNPPTASFTASPGAGNAPLAVTFDPAASQDDTGLSGFDWRFGDGSGSSAPDSRTVQKVFALPGRYTVELEVRDVSGLTARAERQVIVTAPPVRVTRLSVNVAGSGKKKSKAKATVVVVDAQGKPAAKAVIAAIWSGAVSGAMSARSNGAGAATLSSPAGMNGCYRLTVTSIRLGAATYALHPPAAGEACR